jgi:aminoglycoside phosphotransferase
LPLSDPGLDGWAVTPIAIGMSTATVERWTRGEEQRFAKSAAPTWDRGLDAEAARLRWLATTPLARHAPEVVAFESASEGSDGVERLVTTALPGTDLATLAIEAGVSTWRRGPAVLRPEAADVVAADLARRYGAALRALHEGLDPAQCPFDARLDVRLEAAARRVAEGAVDPADFEDEHRHRTPEEVLELLRRTRPDGEDLVVTHGDWCPPNVLFAGDGPDGWGIVDLADLGVACRWYDLGIGQRSTAGNLGAAAVPAFFDGYGIEPDEERIAWYVLLDELQ